VLICLFILYITKIFAANAMKSTADSSWTNLSYKSISKRVVMSLDLIYLKKISTVCSGVCSVGKCRTNFSRENQGVDIYVGQHCDQQLSPGLPVPMQVDVKYDA